MNILTSGKIGDFVIALSVAYYYSKFDTINLYYHSKFAEGYDFLESYKELKLLTDTQSYINSFDVYNHDATIDINMMDFRFYRNIYEYGWLELMQKIHKIVVHDNYQWLFMDKKEEYKDTILIHRSLNRLNEKFPWESIINKYGDKIKFISTFSADYENFQFRDKVEYIKTNNIVELAILINSCESFIGNMSLPLTLSMSLNKNRFMELYGDQYKLCYNDLKYYSNVDYYLNDDLKSIKLFDITI